MSKSPLFGPGERPYRTDTSLITNIQKGERRQILHHAARVNEMTEREEAIALANRVLDRINADPDDDLSVLARQFLRAIEPSSRGE